MSEKKNWIWKLLFGIFLAAAVIGVVVTCLQIRNRNQAEEELERLAESTSVSRETESSREVVASAVPTRAPESEEQPEVPEDSYIRMLTEKGIPVPEKEVDFEDLQANVNKDIYAWIYIPDTKIDYPILQHPTDNYYYLEYNLDGSKGYPGCIYTEDYNTKDFTDPNTVIYGHNMKNGTMFAGLHRFEDSEYFAEHPYVYIYTEEDLFVYEIFAAYESGNEHILYNNDFTDRDVFRKYLAKILTSRTMNGNINEEAEIGAGNRIITLSTCVANKSDRRYLLQGVLLEEEPDTGVAMGSAANEG